MFVKAYALLLASAYILHHHGLQNQDNHEQKLDQDQQDSSDLTEDVTEDESDGEWTPWGEWNSDGCKAYCSGRATWGQMRRLRYCGGRNMVDKDYFCNLGMIPAGFQDEDERPCPKCNQDPLVEVQDSDESTSLESGWSLKVVRKGNWVWHVSSSRNIWGKVVERRVRLAGPNKGQGRSGYRTDQEDFRSLDRETKHMIEAAEKKLEKMKDKGYNFRKMQEEVETVRRY